MNRVFSIKRRTIKRKKEKKEWLFCSYFVINGKELNSWADASGFVIGRHNARAFVAPDSLFQKLSPLINTSPDILSPKVTIFNPTPLIIGSIFGYGVLFHNDSMIV